MASVLVVDDEESIRELLEILLRRHGHKVRLAQDAFDAVAQLTKKPADLVLTDLRLNNGTGMDVLHHVQKHHVQTQVIMMTAFATTENAVDAMKAGAYDYVIKPFNADELMVLCQRALERNALENDNVRLRSALNARTAQHRLIGTSTAMRDVFEMVAKVAPTKTNVLLTGQSGTGKELVSRAIHNRGPRAQEPFVPINCGAITETLIESELFGHTKGAFTGAHADKQGLFERSGAGTVFLDEIGELPLAMQVKLLRVLQERKVRRVGGVEDTDVKCRVIAATNRNLEQEVQNGNFREDLFFRLNVIELRLPCLHERREDIPLLVDAFIAKFTEEQGREHLKLTDAAMARLIAYKWPGNVRQLENVIERGVTLAAEDVFDVDALPQMVRESAPLQPAQPEVPSLQETPLMPFLEVPVEGLDLESVLEQLERKLLTQALQHTGGKKKKAAELLQLSFRSFRYRLAKLGIE
ncbi:MAG: sigma-54-dependent Fis family transcriptional regulator [Deltaproteobacteria bacterium]|nr:sigma-54-dependent Fis family transcriptional regulator [Deltaproteobacteria bacterium]